MQLRFVKAQETTASVTVHSSAIRDIIFAAVETGIYDYCWTHY